uniref:Rho termination factor-like N-terminal domain-containing protein n=1 Tax=viral metagenome TaxID=1070528 RepID=A0A6C0HK40_9ZZZZ
MNYHSMKLSELKKVAKERGGIKGYYTMSKKELISFLEMPELPEWLVVTKMTVDALRDLAGKRGLRGYWGYSKAELISTLFPNLAKPSAGYSDSKAGSVDGRTAQEYYEDNREAHKHEDPQNENGEKVGI